MGDPPGLTTRPNRQQNQRVSAQRVPPEGIPRAPSFASLSRVSPCGLHPDGRTFGTPPGQPAGDICGLCRGWIEAMDAHSSTPDIQQVPHWIFHQAMLLYFYHKLTVANLFYMLPGWILPGYYCLQYPQIKRKASTSDYLLKYVHWIVQT